MTPLQYKSFYILADDGATPAAKVVVLAGQLDKIDASKLTDPVDKNHKIIGYDPKTRSDALMNCFNIGIQRTVVSKFVVPMVCFHSHKPKLVGCLLIDLTCAFCSFVLCVCVLFKKCVIGLVIPVYGSDDAEITLGYIQHLRSDALWLKRPADEVLVNPIIAGYDPLSTSGPKEGEKHLWSHSPGRLSDAYYQFVVRHNSNREGGRGEKKKDGSK